MYGFPQGDWQLATLQLIDHRTHGQVNRLRPFNRRSANHSRSSTTLPSDSASLHSNAFSSVKLRPFCCPMIAPTTGPCCWRRVWRVM
ncbi:hypothetical protein KC316_g60 [Hortaea werneckii]|nr:hypothetical protein KC316_g60 [Hortaea werneckii]